MAIYITGDTHGYYPQLMDRLAGNNCHLTKDDILLVTGDFGFVWSYAENIAAFKKLADEPFTVAFIDGNHEEFPLINSFPVSEWNGGNVHRIGTSENIIHLMRGQCFNIEGMSFFTMGGAYSTDKDTRPRTEGVDWFPEELPNNDEYRTASATLEQHNYTFDYILTHTVPDAALYPLGFGPDYHDAELTGYLQWVYTHSKFKKWFAGHFHDDKELLNGNLRILYNDVSHDHHFKWWFEISPIRALLQARPKGRISQANYRLPLKEVIYAYLLAWFLLPVRQYTF